ncbi:MAG: toll/interleukin-1 receptor domain-containing protein, partial [Anaerolineae bacterium]|nr:toll/interleukin-1 receptor domain-containing protein [Anaerolineae bacterium]
VMTPDSASSEWVEKEYHYAESLKKPQFPLLLRGNPFPYYITKQHVDLRLGDLPPATFYSELAKFAPRKSAELEVALADSPMSTPAVSNRRFGYKLFDQEYWLPNQKEVLVDILRKLALRDGGFLERFAEKGTKSRRYVARDRQGLYVTSPHLSYESEQIVPGWYVGTNNSAAERDKIIRVACEVANLEYGKDVILKLGRD